MGIQQIMYTEEKEACDERPCTMVMMVDPLILKKYRKDKSIPLVSVFDSFEVFKFDKPGHEGKLVKPSAQELKATFKTTKDIAIAEFMIAKGQVHGAPHTEGEVNSGNDLQGMKGGLKRSTLPQ